ncbi:type II toxin-antitoxin system VapC family toxin [Candidatus Woesebacteria bacterium]|nr:type II toxin-antitoxin system VapC family toxin [Candidatus Woesebacteria bacterium]
MQYVIDSLVIVKLITSVDERYKSNADLLLIQGEQLHVLELVKHEIGNVILKAKKQTLPNAKQALAFFYTIPFVFHAIDEISSVQIYRLAQKYHLTFYDASFVQLSHQLKLPFVTGDMKHHGKIKEITIIPISQYGQIQLDN